MLSMKLFLFYFFIVNRMIRIQIVITDSQEELDLVRKD